MEIAVRKSEAPTQAPLEKEGMVRRSLGAEDQRAAEAPEGSSRLHTWSIVKASEIHCNSEENIEGFLECTSQASRSRPDAVWHTRRQKVH